MGAEQYNVGSNSNEKLNTGYYHRAFKAHKPGTSDYEVVHKGFADRTLFTAQTTSPRIAPLSIKQCETAPNGTRVCTDHEARYSYAVPLELIWLTPLYSWNPYDLPFRDNKHKNDV